MSEPYWTPLGGQPVDYEGAWAAGTQYAPGDVVRHNGVDYLAVNPSLGLEPSPAVSGGAVVWRGVWSASVAYKPGDLVTYGGRYYQAATPSTGTTPIP